MVAVPFFAPVDASAVSGRAWAGFAYVAVVSQYLGFFAWYRGLAEGGIARVGQVQLLQPFLTIAASALLLAEPASGATWAFAALVVALVAIGRRMRVSAATSPGTGPPGRA